MTYLYRQMAHSILAVISRPPQKLKHRKHIKQFEATQACKKHTKGKWKISEKDE